MELRAPALVLLSLCLSCGGEKEPGNSPAKKKKVKEETGLAIYNKYCKTCHGEKGDLGLSGAKPLNHSVLNRDETVQMVSDGKGAMIPYKDVLTPEQIQKVADYVLTLRN
jgi:mono/diheme cytochrome c family protein